ncbi:MAG TPA: ParB/RepB/Spo0J family partition protein [Thermodesulfobacteriaceae bacterium]|nr:ParB/RepB/Spo0J family partition protein [Thermodesulfobacteriaceae bacterium]
MTLKGGLGRGLGTLLSSKEIFDAGSPGFFLCPIEKIRPNPHQPRKWMNEESLEALAASIREKGVLQPLVVREVGAEYELIAGERRWRAAQQAGLTTIPVIIKDVSPDELLELALIENIQREDLNPLEEAMAYERLVTDLSLTQAQIASKVGRKRSTVANFLRLLLLPDYAKKDLLEERLTMGHARALLTVEDLGLQKQLRDQVIKKGLSVRQTEVLARRIAEAEQDNRRSIPREDPDITRLCEKLTRNVGSPVRIIPTKRGGRLEIRYDSNADLDRIVEILLKALQ